jgi:hypothetical protein
LGIPKYFDRVEFEGYVWPINLTQAKSMYIQTASP